MNKKVLITGATGMIGNLNLQHCLQAEGVSQVVSLVRRSTGVQHPKLNEIIVSDFLALDIIADNMADSFENIDTVYYCLGVYTGAEADRQEKAV